MASTIVETPASHNTSVFIHPLVVLSISDQFTRALMNGKNRRLIGLIAGKRDGLRIEITNTAELVFDSSAMEQDDFQNCCVDDSFYLNRVELLKEMYPNDNVLGWFIIGTANVVDESDVKINRQFAQLMQQQPLLLKFDAETLSSSDQLNQVIYESYLDATDETKILFRQLPIQFETEASELIGLEHMATFSEAADCQHTTASKQLTSLAASMKVFLQRLKVSESFVRETIANEVPWDDSVLEQITKLSQRLKALEVQGNTMKSDLITTSKQVLAVAGITVLQDEVHNISMVLPSIYHMPGDPFFYRNSQHPLPAMTE